MVLKTESLDCNLWAVVTEEPRSRGAEEPRSRESSTRIHCRRSHHTLGKLWGSDCKFQCANPGVQRVGFRVYTFFARGEVCDKNAHEFSCR